MDTYKTVNGTSYHAGTSDAVIAVLEEAHLNRTRLHISLGNGESGKDWLEEHDILGNISVSLGPTRVPLLIANRRSHGGGAILDHCIVRIRESAGGRVLYQHPSYHHGDLQIRRKVEPVDLPDGRRLTTDVLRDGELHASFENLASAWRTSSNGGVIPWSKHEDRPE